MDSNGNKKGLYNKLNRVELLKNLERETFCRRTISFYKYVTITTPMEVRDTLFAEWNSLNCLGRIYVAKEGINAQMNVPEHNFDLFETSLRKHAEFKDIIIKPAIQDDKYSFFKLQIKVRKQIVADGLAAGTYNINNVGTHLSAQEWNKAMEEGATVVDIRNHYESEIGHFKNAILPESETFQDELPQVLSMLQDKKDEKILLYCTGGIRCEKTSSFLKHHGFTNVNQLHGGIIDYAKQIKELGLENKFIGTNFVFDERLGECISEDVISHCHQCESKSNKHVNCQNKDCNLLFIQCDECKTKYKGCCSKECMTIIELSEEEQRAHRKGHSKKQQYHSHKKIDLRLKL